MSGDKFDFNVASALVSAVTASASALSAKNEDMKRSFNNLGEYFKDSGYNVFAGDMDSANKSIEEIISQLHIIAKNIHDYASKLEDATR